CGRNGRGRSRIGSKPSAPARSSWGHRRRHRKPQERRRRRTWLPMPRSRPRRGGDGGCGPWWGR
ncbi:MAG: hypothetical protein AVDCRST_MAG73-3303, partial [uncultured Thermomicrobiales bacterium]